MPHLSASAVVIHYEEALYQVYAPLPLWAPERFFSGEGKWGAETRTTEAG